MDNGSRVTPDEWYAIFVQLNRENFGCAWGVRDFRHATIAISREFISPNHAFSLADELLAESADHSTLIDHIHYGTVRGSIPRLTNNVMAKHRWLSGQWQLFCGLGPGQPQEPIGKQGHPGPPSINILAISEAISSTASEVMNDYLRDNLAPLLRSIITQDVVSPMLDIYMQDKLVPLLRNVITQDVLPSILDTMQCSSKVTASMPVQPRGVYPVIITRHAQR